jgi:hypothetical protein
VRLNPTAAKATPNSAQVLLYRRPNVCENVCVENIHQKLRRPKMKTTLTVMFLACIFTCSTTLGVRTLEDESMDLIGPGVKLPEPGVGLTIYNNNFAVVKERREMDFDAGVNTVKFTDVASAIDPTSVNFKCLSSPGAVSILEQNYEYDLVNTASLLKRYIDKTVIVQIRGSGSDTGTRTSGILSAAVGNDLILRDAGDRGELEIISRGVVERISLAETPQDLVTKPTLVWLAGADKRGSELCQVTYTTGAINWKADYSAVLNENEDKLDLTGWVTIDNKSGAGYKDAIIKLIAGDVRRVTEPPISRRREAYAVGLKGAAEAGFEEKPFMEYHLYTLGRKSTINNNQVKQIELIAPARDVPVKKLYIYEWRKKPNKVQIKLEFENKEENHLGIALPKGKVRVFKKDPADGMLEFVGEDAIDHTARKEKVSLYIGDAFDIVGEHTMTDSEHRRRYRREAHKIELRNRKTESVTIYVDEKFPAHFNWKITNATHDYEKRDAGTARFKVAVKADSTQTLEYTVTQTW